MKTIVYLCAFCYFYLGLFQGFAQPFACVCADVALPQVSSSGLRYPSAIADGQSTGLYLDYQVPYGLWELATKKADFVWAIKDGGLGLSAMQTGFEGYRYSQGSAMVGHKLGEVRAGVRANFHQLAVLGQENTHGISFDASLYMPLSENLYIGTSMKNILQQTWLGQESTNGIPSEITLGIAQKPFDELLWQVAVRKDMERKPAILAGLRYDWGKYVFVNLNYQSQPSQIDLALGFKNKHWALLVATSRHYILGMSHRLLLNWKLFRAKR